MERQAFDARSEVALVAMIRQNCTITVKLNNHTFFLILGLLVACSGADNNGGGARTGAGGAGGTGGSPVCKVAGVSCSAGTECCSNVCGEDGACTEVNQCESAGSGCVSGADCCSGLCVDDGNGSLVCGNGFVRCQALEQSCGTATDCCSLGCDGEMCVEALCKIDGQECAADSDCCSNVCGQEGTCVVPSGCLPAGEACGSGVGATCCSANCVDFGENGMRCGTSGACRVVGEICSAVEDCCSFNCVVPEGETFGQCDTMPGFSECKSVGEPCGQDTTCCSFTCRDNGTGFQSCQYLNGCRPMGELCRQGSDCCNYAVQPDEAVCLKTASEDVGRCQNPGGDAPAGEVCATAGGGASGSNQCEGASGQGLANENCRETSVGTYRCFEDGACLEQGASCALGDQCCSGICAPDVDGNLVCDPVTECPETDPMCTMCVEDGQACIESADCCSGACDPQTLTCKTCREVAETCTANGDCCSSFCDPQTLTCQTIVVQ